MDTDDLSKPTYNGVILECEKYNHDLTLQFGILHQPVKMTTTTSIIQKH